MFLREGKDWFRTDLFATRLLNQFFSISTNAIHRESQCWVDFLKKIDLFEKNDSFKE